MSVEQLRAMGHGPVADRLEQRVDFDAPTTAAEALSKFFGHPTARFIAGALALSVGARCSVGAGFSAVDGGVALPSRGPRGAIIVTWRGRRLSLSPRPGKLRLQVQGALRRRVPFRFGLLGPESKRLDEHGITCTTVDGRPQGGEVALH